MSRAAAMTRTIEEAVAQLGSGSLTEESVQQHIAPLFSRVLASDRVYLANHSLGRPLDAMEGSYEDHTSFGDVCRRTCCISCGGAAEPEAADLPGS